MMGIQISGVSYIYGDNISIVNNTSKSESTLKKKCNVTAYQAVHESVAMKESLTGHIRSENNPADLLTKVVTGQWRKDLVSLEFYDMYDGDS